MVRVKVLFLSLLAVFAVSSVMSNTASAALEGPWWRHPEGGNQIKWPENEEHEIKSINEGAFRLKLKILLMTALLECQKVTNKGDVWNGLHQGEGQAEVIFEECSLTSPTKCTGVRISSPRFYTELMWKYVGGGEKELKEVGQQKIYDAFAPTEIPKESKSGEFRAAIAVLTIPESCKPFGGSFNIEAAGTHTTFTDSHNEVHEIVWGTAALVEPQNKDATSGFLAWKSPNVTRLHHQEKEVVAKLLFGNELVELEGKIKVELVGGGEFGAFNI